MRVRGDRYLEDGRSFGDEMADLWGSWYCDSEVGTLRDVLMHRPGPEIDGINEENYERNLFGKPIDAGKLRAQFDAFVGVYEEHGVHVHYVQNQRTDRPNALYVRDLYVMTPEGAILARPAVPARRGEERAVARTLLELGVPILKTVSGAGTFEGANVMWVDRDAAVIGTSSRTNAEGAAQVEEQLRWLGVSHIFHVHVPFGRIHLDGFMNMVDRRTMLVCPWLIPFDTVKALRDYGVTIIEEPDIEEMGRLGMNLVAIRPGQVVLPAGAPETRRTLEDHGIEVIPVEIDEILKGGGAVHCTTGYLRRDPV